MKLKDLIIALQTIAFTYPEASVSRVAVDTEARCTKAHLYEATGAVFDQKTNKLLGEDITVIHLDI